MNKDLGYIPCQGESAVHLVHITIYNIVIQNKNSTKLCLSSLVPIIAAETLFKSLFLIHISSIEQKTVITAFYFIPSYKGFSFDPQYSGTFFICVSKCFMLFCVCHVDNVSLKSPANVTKCCLHVWKQAESWTKIKRLTLMHSFFLTNGKGTNTVTVRFCTGNCWTDKLLCF